jgi:hypothetical protein
MRAAPGIALFVFLLISQLWPARAHAQVITTGPDSVMVITSDADTVQQKQFFLSGFKNLGRPGRAAVFSAIVPGLGQIYNGAWWKAPIIYATGGVLGYFIIDNHTKFKDFREAVILRRDNADKYIEDRAYGLYNPQLGINHNRGTTNLQVSREFYRRNRDMTVIFSVLAYTMQIAEAYVHGHMREFDVSENLSLRVQPDVFRTPASNSFTPGLTLTLSPKTK